MSCIIATETYEGKRDVKRRLAQAAENSSRVPHAHSEIVVLVEEVVRDETARLGTSYGATQTALKRVAVAFGKSVAWSQNYQALTGLLPELRDMLDEDSEGERLNFNVAVALARAPSDVQKQLLRDAETYFKKGGHAMGYNFIVRRAREIRLERGEKVRGHGFDEKIRFVGIANRLKKLAEGLCGERHSTEYKRYVEGIIDKMDVSEVDDILNDVKFGLQAFMELRTILQSRRDGNYSHLSVVK